jgi:hypothetical protein
MKDTAAQKLAETFAHMARNRIDALFHETSHNTDRESYRLAQQITDGGYDWLDEGMLP